MLMELEGLGGDRTCKGRRILGRFSGNSRSMDMAERSKDWRKGFVQRKREDERKGKWMDEHAIKAFVSWKSIYLGNHLEDVPLNTVNRERERDEKFQTGW